MTELNGSNPVLRIQDLNVSTSSMRILKDVSLSIPRNKVTVLLGPSGCGKTTLLKCINRLVDLYPEFIVSGQIFIEDDDILGMKADLPVLRQKMGLLSQRPYPLPLSIFKNISYGLKLKGVRDKGLISYSVEKNLKEVGLWNEVKDRLHEPATNLSIGQQQRLCLARGLAVKPKVILADEPTSALDPVSSKIIEDLFRKLKTQYTIVLVTHILRQALRLADNVVFMSEGRIIEQGEPGIILKNPSTPELKEYLVEGN